MVNVRSQILVVVAAVIVSAQHVRLPPLHPSHAAQLGYDGILLRRELTGIYRSTWLLLLLR